MVSGQSFGSSMVNLACITSMCSVQCFPGGHSLRSAFVAFTVFVLFMECLGWMFMKFTAFVAFNLVKCNLTKLTTTSLAVKRFTSLAVKRFSSLAV